MDILLKIVLLAILFYIGLKLWTKTTDLFGWTMSDAEKSDKEADKRYDSFIKKALSEQSECHIPKENQREP